MMATRSGCAWATRQNEPKPSLTSAGWAGGSRTPDGALFPSIRFSLSHWSIRSLSADHASSFHPAPHRQAAAVDPEETGTPRVTIQGIRQVSGVAHFLVPEPE